MTNNIFKINCCLDKYVSKEDFFKKEYVYSILSYNLSTMNKR